MMGMAIGISLVLGLPALVLALMYSKANWVSWLFVIQGVFMGVILIIQAHFLRWPRFYALAIVYLGFAIALALLARPEISDLL